MLLIERERRNACNCGVETFEGSDDHPRLADPFYAVRFQPAQLENQRF